jgi:hypothetical protein
MATISFSALGTWIYPPTKINKETENREDCCVSHERSLGQCFILERRVSGIRKSTTNGEYMI